MSPDRAPVSASAHAILESAVHALAVERHHRVRGVAEQQRATVEVPAIEISVASDADRVARRNRARAPGSAAAHRRNRVRRTRAPSAAESTVSKLGSPSLGRNSVTVKRALVVGQRDAHVVAARPDVQRVGGSHARELPPESRRRAVDFQFLVAVAERFDALAELAIAVIAARSAEPAPSAPISERCMRVRARRPLRSETQQNVRHVEVDAGRGGDRNAVARPPASAASSSVDIQLAAADRPDHFASRRARSAAIRCARRGECTMRPRIITACGASTARHAGECAARAGRVRRARG